MTKTTTSSVATHAVVKAGHRGEMRGEYSYHTSLADATTECNRLAINVHQSGQRSPYLVVGLDEDNPMLFGAYGTLRTWFGFEGDVE